METKENKFKIKSISLTRSSIKKKIDFNQIKESENASDKNTKKSHAEIQNIYIVYCNIIDTAFILFTENNNTLWKDHFSKIIVDGDLIKWDLDNKAFIPLTSVGRLILSKYKFWIIGLAYLQSINNYSIYDFLQLILNSRSYKLDDDKKYNENLILVINRCFNPEEIRNLINKINNKSEESELNYSHYEILLKEMTNKLNNYLDNKNIKELKRSYSMSSINDIKDHPYNFEKMKEYLVNIPQDILLKFKDIVDKIKDEKQNNESGSKKTQINKSNKDDNVSFVKIDKNNIEIENQISILIKKKISLKSPTENDIKKLADIESHNVNIEQILDDGHNMKLEYFIDKVENSFKLKKNKITNNKNKESNLSKTRKNKYNDSSKIKKLK